MILSAPLLIPKNIIYTAINTKMCKTKTSVNDKISLRIKERMAYRTETDGSLEEIEINTEL